MSGVPSVTLNLGTLEDENLPQDSLLEIESMVKKATHLDVEKEKCVIAQYKTSSEQLDTFMKLLNECDVNYIPLEWVIDIADESNGWFYGTAYHYNDSTNMLHVMVPDKLNPSFDGEIPLDHRTVHLVECVDGKTEALFNKIVRDSVTKVRWEVEWFEEGNGNEKQIPELENSPEGRWVLSIARYYIQMANQLLVEDEDIGQDSRGFVMLTADINVKLRTCFKGKGFEDFTRLISENIVQSIPNAIEISKKSMTSLQSDHQSHRDQRDKDHPYDRQSSSTSLNHPSSSNASSIHSVRKLSEMSRGLRECLSDILDDRERLIVEHEKMSKAFNSFVLDGDLDAGLKLMAHTEIVTQAKDHHKHSSNSTNNLKSSTPITKKALEREQQQELMDSAAEDVWYLAQRVEKSSMKLLKSGGVIEGNGNGMSSPNEELEYLRRTKAKMQKEIEERDRELEILRGKVGR